MSERYTDEFLVSEFLRFKNEYGRYPLSTDFRKNRDYPHCRNYERRWGSWKKFIVTLNILGENGWYKEDEDLVRIYYPLNNLEKIKENLIIKRTDGQIRKYANKLGLYLVKPVNIDKEQFVYDYKNLKMTIKQLATKYNCGEGTIHKFINDNKIPLNTRRWTTEKIKYLKENYSFEDWDIILDSLYPFDKEAIIAKAYKLQIPRECFGWSEEEIRILIKFYENVSFSDIKNMIPDKTDSAIMTKANKLGLSMREKWSEEDIELINKLYPFYTNEELLEYFPDRTLSAISSMGTMKLNLNKSPELLLRIKDENKKKLLEDLIAFANELGRTPTTNEISENKELAGISSYTRYFGTYTDACIEADLPVNQAVYWFGEKRDPIYSKNNDNCLSIAEKIITDFMIDNGVVYEKSESLMYKNYINDDRFGRKRFDWLIDNEVIVEYFGMMEQNFYRKKTEIKLKLCNDNNVKIIDLYPEDLKNNLKGIKEKLAPYIKINIEA